jgi:hypothetical protein
MVVAWSGRVPAEAAGARRNFRALAQDIMIKSS